MLTVFTPTYNRAYTLERLYGSLCSQSCQDFEWLIVDDGSTDNTEALIKSLSDEGNVKIRYIHQNNAGKHVAINRGVAEAQGELFMIVDSDDLLTSDSIEWIILKADSIMSDDRFAGISGTRITLAGRRIGGDSNFETLDCSAIDIRLKHRINGDLAEIFKTKILKQFPFPEFDGERFCPEALIWHRIACKYQLRYFNKGIYVCEYLSDGLTAKITRLRRQSPQASMLYYSEFAHLPISMAQKAKGWINFWRFAQRPLLKSSGYQNLLSLLCFIPGRIMRLRDN